ncbi:hypothetical protein ABZV65_13815 [Streptomyces bauhiniae]|uniref:hypothetical protein n=1 Tax=Streptomyces bauhiniae TaxID=2340725 RepID=UPI0033A40572
MSTCTACTDRDAGDRYLCDRCTTRLGDRLAGLPDLYAELSITPRVTGLAEVVTAAPVEARAPIDLTALDMPGNAAWKLEIRRRDIQRVRWPERSGPEPASLMAHCRWLRMELEWIAAHYPAADKLDAEVYVLEAQALSILGTPPPRAQRLGYCVAVTDDAGTVCGAVLTRLPGEPVRCRWCRTEYRTETDLLLLRHYQPEEVA